jgi:hypothetical protein
MKKDKSEGKSETLWTKSATDLLEDWRNRVYACQVAYFFAASNSRKAYYWLGVPTVIISAIVGTAIFAGAGTGIDAELFVRIVLGTISVIATVLSALQTFFNFSELANRNARAGEMYASIRRQIEEVLALPAELRPSPQQCLESIRRLMDEAGEKTPEISRRVWRSVARIYEVKDPGAGHILDRPSEEPS